jgi:PAS domain S-box-containing protein
MRLAEINRAITISLNFDEVLDLIVKSAAQLVGARISALLLVDKEGQLKIRAAQGIDADNMRDFAASMGEEAIRELGALVSVGPDEMLVSVPVIAKHAVNGMLAVVRERQPHANEEWQLSALADQAAIALQNARLYEMELAEANRERDESLEALSESNQRITRILESITDLFYSLDTEWRFTQVNKRVEEKFRRTRDELLGHVIWEMFPHAVDSALYTNLVKAMNEMTPQHFEVASKIVTGTWFEVHAYPSETGLTAYLRDITERKQSEEEILFQARLLSAVEQAVIATDLEGKVIYWNSFAERLYGWPAAEAIGTPIVNLTTPNSSRELAAEIFAKLKAGGSWSGEFEVQRRDGSVFPAMVTDSPIFNDRNELIGVVGVSADITERKQAEEERTQLLAAERAARSEAEEANRLKDEFLATLSHELRNPLNVVIGYAEILRRSNDAQDPDFVLKAAETIHRNALAQSRLVSDLLDLSRLEMGKLSLNRQPVSLSTIIRDAIETVRDEAAAKRITLTVDFASDLLIVDGDPIRLGQIAWNLLNNAVKFTPNDGEVRIFLRQNGDDAELIISDSGQGIATDFLPHVFELFRQADGSSARRHGGMGIGLALVKQLAELHGGRVKVESRGTGHGATFTIWFPLDRADATDAKGKKKGSTGALNSKAILVVDDSQETTEMLSNLLTLEGAQVETARSGPEALRLAKEHKFDLIISDISMPEMDGYELLRAIRAQQSSKDVPAVALTGYGRNTDIERALAEGFAEHLTKPLDIDRLMRIVKKLTGGLE